jgi:hypothetical protein
MKIRLIGHSKNPTMTVGTQGPWFEFKKTLEKLGNQISTEKFRAQNDCLIANTHSKEAILECKVNKTPINRRILILWEPKIVVPKIYSRRVLSKYGKIYTPSVDWSEKVNGEIFKWPQLDLRSLKQNHDNWELRKNKAVMVLANKFSASRGEQYSLRRELNLLCGEKNIMDLYGAKWNEGNLYNLMHYVGSLLRTPIANIDLSSARLLKKRFSNFKGHSENKSITLSGYAISVVIENSSDYISEKLFDSVASGAITIYVGPNLERYGLSGETAIQTKASAKEIIKVVRNLQSKSIDEQRKIAKNQYNSLLKAADKWEGNLVLTTLARDIHSYLESTITQQ